MSVDLPHAAIGTAVAGFELFGVGVITLGSLLACGRFAFLHTKVGLTARYHALRQELGGTIVLGLEFLVAADIIRTVTIFIHTAMIRCDLCAVVFILWPVCLRQSYHITFCQKSAKGQPDDNSDWN